MRYIGSKRRVFKYIKPFLTQHLTQSNGKYFEPFVGGANSLIQFNWYNLKRYGWDINEYIVALWNELRLGWVPPSHVSKEEYEYVKQHKKQYPLHEVGYVGIMYSFGGTWFRGYKGDRGNLPNNPSNSLILEAHKLKDVKFEHRDFFRDWERIPERSIVYCDPPYQKDGVRGYTSSKVDYDVYRNLSQESFVYISENEDSMPHDFERLFRRTLIYTNKGVKYTKVECLYIYAEGLASINMTALARFQSEALI